jgi:hypothetical protein
MTRPLNPRRSEAARRNYEGSVLYVRNAALKLGKDLNPYRMGQDAEYEAQWAGCLTSAADLCGNTEAAKAQINAGREAYMVSPFFPGEPPVTIPIHDIAVVQPTDGYNMIFLRRGDVLVPADTLICWQ